MLAMPLSSSELPQQAVLQFIGPSSTKPSSKLSTLLGNSSSSSSEDGGTVYIKDPRSGALNPAFSVQFSKSKPNITFSKVMPEGTLQVIGTSEKSELSGKFTLSLHGQEAEMGYNSWGTRRLAIPSIGDFKMETGLSGSSVKFIDPQKVKIAKCSWSEAEPTLEIYVQGVGDFLVEMLVLAGLAQVYSARRDAKATKAGLKVVEALAGIPSSGG